MSVTVVATLFPVPEAREEILALLQQAIPQVHSEPGCELYALHQGKDRLVLIEKWASPADLQTHAASEGFAQLGQFLDGKLTAPLDVQVLEAVPLGDKGTV